MKPQLYSIFILLLARINYAQKAENSTQNAAASATQLPSISPNSDNVTSITKAPDDHKTSAPETTSITKAPDDHKTSAPETTSITKAPDDHKTSAPESTENDVTSVTKAPKGNTTSVIKTSRETVASKIPTVLPEAPNNKATSTPSLVPNVPPVRTTKGFTTTTASGGIPGATGNTSISKQNQTSNPIVAGNGTTQRINKVTNAVRKTTRPTSPKPTPEKVTGNRTSAFPVPSLFAIVLLVIAVLCF